MERQLTISLRATRRLISHNGRLANPLDPYTRELALLTGKRKKTLEDHWAIAQLEARASLYETPDGKVGFTNEAVWRCIFDAAKVQRLGQLIKRALLFEPRIEPLRLSGKTYTPESFLALPSATLTRVVVVNGKRLLRTRPITPTPDWEMDCSGFILLDDVLELHQLEALLGPAGKLFGIGEWRPRFGTFMAGLGQPRHD